MKNSTPSEHQAISMVENTDGAESNTIVEVMQKGFRCWNNRLVRPAMVVVAK